MTVGNHRGSIRPVLVALVVLFLSGCSTNTVHLTYDRPDSGAVVCAGCAPRAMLENG